MLVNAFVTNLTYLHLKSIEFDFLFSIATSIEMQSELGSVLLTSLPMRMNATLVRDSRVNF